MLNEQKRYLYLPYLFLSCSFACLIGLLLVRFSHPPGNGFFETALLPWLLYYLMPVIILLFLLSRMLWFGRWTNRLVVKCLRPVVGISVAWLLVGTGAVCCYFFPIPGCYILSAGVLLLLNYGMIKQVKLCGPESNLIKSAIIVGTGARARNLSLKIGRHPEWGIRVAGFLSQSDDDIDADTLGHTVLGTVESIGTVLNRCIVDMIVITPEKGGSRHVDAIVQRCRLEGIDVGFLTDLNLPTSSETVMEQLEDVRLWIIRFVPLQPEKLFLKRCIDFTASVAAFCLCLPLWVMLPILVLRDSPGPILFRQTRAGKNGRPFTMFKFRSMVTDAENRRNQLMHLNEMDGPVFKMKEDPRVTRIGAFLRKTSLDELPQLFNVVKGDISLVGPRPPLFEEVRRYRPWERKRLSVLQGITGLWQISGRNEIKFDEWMKLDLLYIDQWRFSLDLLVLLKTIPAVIARKGAQ